MSYIPFIVKTIDYIEENIRDDISLEKLAFLAGFSKFHFLRVFKAVTDNTVADYIRKRRLTLAANDLLDSQKGILEIAMTYRYNSQEAFTRAFKDRFKMTPMAYRNNNFPFVNSEKAILSGQVMEFHRDLDCKPLIPRIVQLDPITVLGFQISNRAPGATSSVWNRFDQNQHRIKHPVRPPAYYGIEKLSGSPPLGSIVQYMACQSVEHLQEMPADMTSDSLPANQYAVFSITAVPEFLQKAIMCIYSKWLPEYGLHPVGDYDFEYYDEAYRQNDPKSHLDFYIPVQSISKKKGEMTCRT